MLYTILISLLCLIIVQANPVKRSIFDNLPIGGNLGCVVTGNTLYINGLSVRQLNPDEVNELQQYQNSLTNFQQQMQTFSHQMRQMRRQMRANRMNGQTDSNSMEQNDYGNNNNNNNNMPTNMPTPPTLPSPPSFCSDNATTQYIFDGCKVQDGKVYVGNTYARDLTPDEQNQLQQYVNQLNNLLNQQIQNQINGLMAQSTDTSAEYSGNDDNNNGSADYANSPTASTDVSTSTSSSPSSLPQPPNFCTPIY